MSDTATTWWFRYDRTWHLGATPPGWWQAPDRRWHPPRDPGPETWVSKEAAAESNLERSGFG
jgi:hypothetical protein